MSANKNTDRAAVVELYSSGKSSLECSIAFGISTQMVWRIIKQDAPHCMHRKRGPLGKRPNVTATVYAPEATGTILEMFFNYDPENGIFYHKTGRGGRSGGAGFAAGSKMTNGYVAIGLPGGKKILAHRLAWLWMVGRWPETEIDHINGARDDNRICNLREATRPQQGANGGKRSTNTSGVVGVSFDTGRKKWTACIGVEGKTLHLGRFNSLEEATSARAAAEIKYFGEFRATPRDGWSPPPCH